MPRKIKIWGTCRDDLSIGGRVHRFSSPVLTPMRTASPLGFNCLMKKTPEKTLLVTTLLKRINPGLSSSYLFRITGLIKSADLLTPSEPDAGSSAPDGNIQHVRQWIATCRRDGRIWSGPLKLLLPALLLNVYQWRRHGRGRTR